MRPVFALLLVVVGLHAADPRAELQALAPEVAKLSRAFNLVHEVVAPSVVSIHTRANQRQVVGRGPFGSLRIAEREVEVGEGSGFAVKTDGTTTWILTNAHVVLQTNDELVRQGSNLSLKV